MCHANYPTRVLGEVVRERGLLTVEEAVEMMTDRPARLYGLRGRGRIEPGWHADLVVFDPATVASEPAETGGRPARRRRAARGRFGGDRRTCWWPASRWWPTASATAARPGRVLRSGRDTETVSLADVRRSPPRR